MEDTVRAARDTKILKVGRPRPGQAFILPPGFSEHRIQIVLKSKEGMYFIAPVLGPIEVMRDPNLIVCCPIPLFGAYNFVNLKEGNWFCDNPSMGDEWLLKNMTMVGSVRESLINDVYRMFFEKK